MGSEGGRKTSTQGKRSARGMASFTPTMQPISASTRSGLRSLMRSKLAQPPDGLVLGLLPHDAGVEHHHVGVFGAFGWGVTQALQARGHALGVRYVHLAADGPNVILHFYDILGENGVAFYPTGPCRQGDTGPDWTVLPSA